MRAQIYVALRDIPTYKMHAVSIFYFEEMKY